MMLEFAQAILYSFDWFVLGYYLALNSSYVLLLSVAAVDLSQRLRRQPFVGHDDLFANPLTPGVSILLPAYNEAEVVVDSAHALMEQRYPNYELIIIDDGSTDDTFERLTEAFDLVEVPLALTGDIALVGDVTNVYSAHAGVPLTVVRKRNAMRVADALNAGLLLASKPLVCMIDADSLLEEDALLRMVAPFVHDPQRVIAAGGTVRPLNGSQTYRGRVTKPMMPSRMLARIQVVEYMRAFLMARLGWARLRALPIISGAFGIYRRDLLNELGGMRTDAIGQDLELLLRVYRHIYRRGRGERIGFIPDPVCWTQVPDGWSSLSRQRTRWSQGLAEALFMHRGAIANPRYGRVGMLLLPYLLLFELMGPLIEVTGIVAICLGLVFGLLNVPFALLFLLVAVGYSLVVSLASLALEEFAFFRYSRWRDLVWFVVAAFVEQFGFRQAHAWWRLRGLARSVRGARTSWGQPRRSEFTKGQRRRPRGPTPAGAAR